jgi:hypothetical protein
MSKLNFCWQISSAGKQSAQVPQSILLHQLHAAIVQQQCHTRSFLITLQQSPWENGWPAAAYVDTTSSHHPNAPPPCSRCVAVLLIQLAGAWRNANVVFDFDLLYHQMDKFV